MEICCFIFKAEKNVLISGHCVPPLPSFLRFRDRGTHSLMRHGRLPQLQRRRHEAHYPNFLPNILTPGHSVRVSQLRVASQNPISLQSSSPGAEKSASASGLWASRWQGRINGASLQRRTMNQRSCPYSCHVPSIPQRHQTGSERTRHRENLHRLLL